MNTNTNMMDEHTALLTTPVPQSIRDRIAKLAKTHGLTVRAMQRLLIEHSLQQVESGSIDLHPAALK